MGKTIKTFSDGSYLEYDKGKFDEWCVYLSSPYGNRHPPRDVDYFFELKELSKKYGVNRLYQDYILVYQRTNGYVSNEVLSFISQIAKTYGVDALKIDTIFSILYMYMAMIAEERKQNTRLGKRIKRLGIYALLIENRTVWDSANFMRGMGWREIDALCKAKGF